MRRFIGGLIFVAVLSGLLILLWPQVQKAQRYTALLQEPAPTAGTLPNPLPGQRLVNTWGGARSQGRKHEGIDIFAPRNTPIHSTTRGVVLHIGPNTLGGRTVTILGPGRQQHYYAHLERYPALTPGEWVKAGDVVGYVGDSGNAKGTPTHLHYGIYTTRGAINPFPLLKTVKG